MHDVHPGPFGSCCETLATAMSTTRSFLFVEDDVLYLTVARTPVGRPRFYDHAMFFCPFCGARLQTKDGVAEKVRGAAE